MEGDITEAGIFFGSVTIRTVTKVGDGAGRVAKTARDRFREASRETRRERRKLAPATQCSNWILQTAQHRVQHRKYLLILLRAALCCQFHFQHAAGREACCGVF